MASTFNIVIGIVFIVFGIMMLFSLLLIPFGILFIYIGVELIKKNSNKNNENIVIKTKKNT